MKRLCLILALLLAAVPALAFDLEALAAQLATPAVIRGEFVQEKHLRAMPQALTSRGEFILSREYGLLWLLHTPIRQDYRITDNGIARRVGQGWQAQPNNTVAARQSRLFLAVLGGDYHGLARDFNLTLTGDAQRWQVRLVPRSILLGKIFAHIEIHGGALVERVELNETQGERTVLQLAHSVVDTELTAEEQTDFAAR